MKLVKLSIIIASLFLVSCNNDKEPLSNNVDNSKEEFFEIRGDFEAPEMVDLGDNNSTRALVLRPNTNKYPKIVFPELDNGASFEPFFSSVWLHNVNNTSINRRIFVEDRGGEHAHEGSTQLGANASATSRANRSGATEKGVSRILKIGDKYKVFIRFSGTSATGRSADDSWVNTYNTNHRYALQIALNPLTNGGGNNNWPSGSAHRIYVPTLFRSDGNANPTNMEVSLPPLKLVSGDYHIGHSSSDVVVADRNNPTGPGNKLFRIPLISNYHYTKTADNSNFIKADLTFKMRGVLLSMSLQNKTGKNIIVKKVRTKSNNLAYVGFYDLWHSDNSSNRSDTPVFSRAGDHEHLFQSYTYTFDVQEENSTNPVSISANSESAGRVYLWGGIDKYMPTNGISTKVQFIYAYADAPDQELVSETLELTPKTAPNKFEEGKVYLINIPISKPVNSGEFSYNDFDKSENDWQ